MLARITGIKKLIIIPKIPPIIDKLLMSPKEMAGN
jgi:hypothetical protein